MKKIVLAIVAILVVVGIGALYQSIPGEDEIRMVNMMDINGAAMGTIRLSETANGVTFDLALSGLKPEGEHAFHVHEVGKCEPEENFKTAGGHYNPTGHAHGMKHPEGSHAGDMPNLKPNDKGKIAVAIVNTKVTLGDGDTSVFDEDGSSIIIHAGADDHMSQPSGAAGDRIACGVIE